MRRRRALPDEERFRARLVQTLDTLDQDPRAASSRRRLNRQLRAMLPKTDVPGHLEGWDDLVGRVLDRPGPAWTERRIPKASGGVRVLHIPSPTLASVQRRTGQMLAAGIPVGPQVAGFHPARRVAWHLRMHEGARTALVMDIRDFFSSVRRTALHRLLHGRWLPTWSEEGVSALLDLTFLPEDGLAQGAPSSPILANLAGLEVDAWLNMLLHVHLPHLEVRYCRYADDMVLSTTIPGADELLERGRSWSWRRSTGTGSARTQARPVVGPRPPVP